MAFGVLGSSSAIPSEKWPFFEGPDRGLRPVRHANLPQDRLHVDFHGCSRDRAREAASGLEPAEGTVVPYQLIRQAILDRRCASALYEDYVRVFCPRTIGKDVNGAAVVEAFQSAAATLTAFRQVANGAA
jgi:hypothetical protein